MKTGIDPTKNVLDLVAAAVLRQDDLAEAERRFNAMVFLHQKEISMLRATHQREWRQSETDRAETLRKQVESTAQQASAQRSTDLAEVNKRLSALELSSSEGKGKQAVADPQLAQMVEELRKLTSARSTTTGRSDGISLSVALLLAALPIAISLFVALKAALTR